MTRHRCADDETLAAYFDGLLSPADEADLMREMRTCPDCLEVVSALGLVIADDTPDAWKSVQVPAEVTARAKALWPAESVIDKAVRIAVRWIGEALEPLADALAPMPAAAVAVRGAAARRDDLRYHVTLGDLPVEVDLEVDGIDAVAVTVRPIHPPPAGTILRLTADGETRALSSLDGEGATVDALPLGRYRLSIEHGADPVGAIDLDLLH